MAADLKTPRPGAVLKVGFILLPGFDLLAFTGIIETLRQTIELGDVGRSAWASWSIMAGDPAPVASSCGAAVIPGGTWRDQSNFDYLAVVGGRLSGADAIRPELLEYLGRTSQRKIPVVGLSSAVFVLAQAGLLRGRRCAVPWPLYQEFKTRFPATRPVIDEIYVEDRGVITCPGGTASFDLARHLLEEFYGPERLVKIMRRILVDWNRPVDRRETPALSHYLDIPDARVRRAAFFMVQNLSINISTEDAAREAGLSPRQLERLFQDALGESPAAYLRDLRLRQANWLVRQTRKTITDIATECGFADSSHFAKWYKEFFGQSPVRDRKAHSDCQGGDA